MVGGSCSCVTAIQVDFGNLSTYRRRLLQFIMSFIDTLYFFSLFFVDSCKALFNLCVKGIRESYCNNAFEFLHIFSMDIGDTHIHHDRSGSSLFLSSLPPCTSSCLVLLQSWHLNSGDQSISAVREEPSVCFAKGVALQLPSSQ